jgi:lipopolysaccharide/colanic/teichoic acid biosynthesis glycosyltransferase
MYGLKPVPFSKAEFLDRFLEKLYTSNWSIWLDILVILRTMAEVFGLPMRKKSK